MVSVLLSEATILTVDQADTVHERGWISFTDGRITGLGPLETRPSAECFDQHFILDGHLVMPGLINAHTHSPMILFRGHTEGYSLLTMEGWYNSVREPELSLEASDIKPSVALSCAEMLLSGTTTFCEQYFFADEIAEAADESGIRAVIAYGIVQLGDRERGERELAAASAFIERQSRAGGRIVPWFGPHAPYVDNSEDLIRAEVETAIRYGCGMHLHMAAGPEDNAETMARYGLTATEALHRDGFFNGRVHAAHCLDLSPEDIAIFAAAPAASVAHCATAGLRSGKPGICPVKELRAAGITVALGTDNVAANNSYDMIAEMRVAGLAASHREGVAQPISSRELVRMATIDGARALGLDHETGSLEVGKAADIIAIDMNGPGYSPVPDIATLLVYSGSGRDISHVFVAGEALVVEKRLIKQDLATLRHKYETTYRRFWARVEAAREAI
ncbi:amidohydrolase [Martelella alba]|uniref:Amidohydrolase n=1 Tax=Martelella alba TaxID=2590451 RepID=A0A506UEG3_9HYPH|nr:amidohydrolase [Martelella alba]TPW32380.1 amidohydrolase [Martelella alba]